MKYFSAILCIIVAFSAVNAQTGGKPKLMELGNIVSDLTSVSLEEVTKKLSLAPIADSKNTIEIRLYSGIGFPGTQCVVLEYDTKWKASKLKLNTKDSTVKQNLKPVIGIESIVKSMISNNVFSLPAQDKINAGNYKLDLATNQVKLSSFTISDAACYYIQFKVGDQTRQYKYCDPKGYAAFYKGQHEYLDFAAILKQFARLEVK